MQTLRRLRGAALCHRRLRAEAARRWGAALRGAVISARELDSPEASVVVRCRLASRVLRAVFPAGYPFAPPSLEIEATRVPHAMCVAQAVASLPPAVRGAVAAHLAEPCLVPFKRWAWMAARRRDPRRATEVAQACSGQLPPRCWSPAMGLDTLWPTVCALLPP